MSSIVLLGAWRPPALAVARSCHRQGVPVYLLEVGARRCRWRLYSSALAGGAALQGEDIGTPRGVETVRAYADAVGAEALVAMDDTRLVWLAQNRGALGARCRLLAPPAETLDLVSSKCNQIAAAREVGFDVLPTVYLPAASGQQIPEMQYPLVLRPDRKTGPRSPFKVRLLHSPAELAAFVAAWDGTGAPLIAQPFRSLPNLVVHGARGESGDILALQAFLAPRKFEGITLTLQAVGFPPNVERRCRDFVDAMGITGCFHFEFLVSPEGDRVWFLEINARLGGTTDKVTRLGFDETAYLLGAYGISPPPRGRSPLSTGLAGDRRALVKHLVRALCGSLTPLDHPPGSRLHSAALSFRDLWTVADSVLDRRDLRGSLWWSPRGAAGP
ncbi:MAG: hypothetical protein P1P84_12260 [Deferrisomatales bacterium]|nr:hypothetical protein [Deferrisomatales bacterium]